MKRQDPSRRKKQKKTEKKQPVSKPIREHLLTVLFVLAGIVLAVVPLGLWIYWDDTLYKHNTCSIARRTDMHLMRALTCMLALARVLASAFVVPDVSRMILRVGAHAERRDASLSLQRRDAIAAVPLGIAGTMLPPLGNSTVVSARRTVSAGMVKPSIVMTFPSSSTMVE